MEALVRYAESGRNDGTAPGQNNRWTHGRGLGSVEVMGRKGSFQPDPD